MSRCSICKSPNVASINALLEAGTHQKDVAAQFGVSRFAVSRHARHSKIAIAPEPATNESLEMQARKWRNRADQLWDRAEFDSDTRGLAQAVSAGLRSVELQARAEIRAAETTPATGEDAPVTIQMIDEIIARAEAEANATPRGRWLRDLQLAPDEILEIAARMLNDAELFQQIKRQCAGRPAVAVN
jgi:hypothetical protein